MSNRLKRLRDYSDIVFKKAPRSIDVFVVIKDSSEPRDIIHVTKTYVERVLLNGHKKVVVLAEDGTTVLAINYLDNV